MRDANEPASPVTDATGSSPNATSAERAATGFDPQAVVRLEAAIDARVAAGEIPGAVLLMARGGELVERAFGRQRPDAAQAMAIDTIFRIYSMTKPVVSVAVMMLAEAGRFLISDPVSKFLPEFRNVQVGVEVPDADGKPVLHLEPCRNEMTIQDLLRHTAGLTYEFLGDSAVQRQYAKVQIASRERSNEEFSSTLAALPLMDQPGSVWEYSRATDVLGRLVEVVSGQSLGQFLHDEIFVPLGMHDTGFAVPRGTTPPHCRALCARPRRRNPHARAGAATRCRHGRGRWRLDVHGHGLRPLFAVHAGQGHA